MTLHCTGRHRLVDSLLVGAGTSALTWLLGVIIFPGLRSLFALASVGIIAGVAWWWRDDLRSRGAFALVAAIPVAPIVGAFVVSPTFTLHVLGKEPAVVLLAALLLVMAVRLAWVEVAADSTPVGIGAAGAWAIVAGVGACAVAVLAVLLAYGTGNVGI